MITKLGACEPRQWQEISTLFRFYDEQKQLFSKKGVSMHIMHISYRQNTIVSVSTNS